MSKSRNLARMLFPTVLMALLLGGCGGSSSTPEALQPQVPGVGKVALLFTDAPTEDFDHIMMSFDEVTLLGDDGQVAVYPQSAEDGEITIDLLALRQVADLAFIRDVPAGTYSKMRLHVTNIDLIKGDVISPVDLVANGKVDMNPQGDFQIMDGQTMFIQLDIDANRSFQAHQSGNGRWHFRPVVFMDIFGDFRRLMRIHGDVTSASLDADQPSFELLHTGQVAETGGMGMGMGMGMAEGSGDTIRVYPGDSGVFGETDGTDQGLTAIQVTEPLLALTAIGYFRSHLGMSGAEMAEFDAVVIELGEAEAFSRVAGMALGAPSAYGPEAGTQVFDWAAGSGQDVGEGTVLTTQLQAKTRVFDSEGREYIDGSAITQGVTGRVDGIDDSGLFRSSLVVLDAASSEEQLAGTVADPINAVSRTFVLTTDSSPTVCVADDAQILVLDLVGDVVTVTPAGFGDIALDQNVEVTGVAGEAGACFKARLVIIDLLPVP